MAALLLAKAGATAPARLIGCGVLVFTASWLLYWMVPLPDLMSERRAYLPLFGAAIAVAGLVDTVAARTGRHTVLAALLPAILIALPLHAALYHRALLWASPERLWEEAARLAPARARPAINLGVIAAGRGDLDAARAQFDRAVTDEPRNPEALYNRGKWRLDAGELAGAESDLAASVAADPAVPRARINHAVALIRLGRIDAAAGELEAALAIDPGDPRALTNYAEVLRARGRTGDAVAIYREALASDPNYAHAAARLGVALENDGDTRGALAAYREYLRRGAASEADAAAVRAKIEALEAALAAPGSIR
jgi:tetratricopeptide (TPR) repeat protein